MDRVCYILGAGFSAPLGLPVMNTFLVKSKDLFAMDPRRYAYFREVFEQVDRMSVSKNYFNTDLFNIEEILSILEMQSFLEGGHLEATFIRYIKDVIEHYTPELQMPGTMEGTWQTEVFGRDQRWLDFGYFVAAIANATFEWRKCAPRTLGLRRVPDPQARYSVVTLNYDRVVEKVLHVLNQMCSPEAPILASRDNYSEDWSQLNVAKLHGSIDSNIIVPPTWSKGIHGEIVPIWKLAYNILVNSNHIRFIGYSLPAADAYVKYLLKAAALKAGHLKSIDVVCLDPSGEARRTYGEFVPFKFFRFANARTEAYLQNLREHIMPKTVIMSSDQMPDFSQFEDAHEAFMKRHLQGD